MKSQWACWRLVGAGWASLTELKTSWTILDVIDANEALDAVEQARAQAAPRLPK